MRSGTYDSCWTPTATSPTHSDPNGHGTYGSSSRCCRVFTPPEPVRGYRVRSSRRPCGGHSTAETHLMRDGLASLDARQTLDVSVKLDFGWDRRRANHVPQSRVSWLGVTALQPGRRFPSREGSGCL